MKKKNYLVWVTAVGLTGVLLLGGCGASLDSSMDDSSNVTNDSNADGSGSMTDDGNMNNGGSAVEDSSIDGSESTVGDNKIDDNDRSTDDGSSANNSNVGNSSDMAGETASEAGGIENSPSGNGAVQEEESRSAEAADGGDGSAGTSFASGEAKAGAAESRTDSTGGAYDLYDEIAPSKKMEKQSYFGSCYSYDWSPEMYSSEEYSKWDEKGFVSVMKEPLSTFAADVDTASYSNLRRLIREGYDLNSIPEGAVRIEEMVNYFSYDYKEPKGEDPFGVTTQISGCPWNEEAELLMIGLKTKDIDYSQAPPANLVFLLDVSGSMDSYDKLPLLQESFGLLAENLTKSDRISIVTYAADTRTVLDGASGNETQKILKALNSLQAGGGTYGSKGIETAYALAEKNFIEGGNNRIILATDGDLNIGMTTEEELKDLITAKRKFGIFLSVLGFGTGNIKDNKMETLADKGNGNYAYIDGLREARKVLVEEMSATLLTICKDVKFQVEFNPSVVKSYRLLGYENRALNAEDFQDDTKDAGEIGAGHSVTALYEIILKTPLNVNMTERQIEDLKYSREYKKEFGSPVSDPTAGKEEWLTINVRYKKPAGSISKLRSYPVGYESYTSTPTDDFIFASAVAEFGLLVSHSEYPEDASMYHVERTLRSMDLPDEYKQEFLELVQMIYATIR